MCSLPRDVGYQAILAEARQMHIGVLTTTGPHVTPELYAWDDRNVWFVSAANTVKSRVVDRDRGASAVVRSGRRTLIVGGTVTKFDLAQPRRLLELAPQAVRAVTALGAFTLRNAADLAGFARDLTAGRLPSRLPPHRVLLRMEIERTIVVDGTAVVAVTGDWASGRTSSNNSASAEPGPEAGGVDCVVGVAHEGRVVALPGRCDVSASAVAVPANVVSVVGLPSDVPLEGCVVVDAYNLPGPAAKSGTLLRGQATITDAGGEWRQVQMSAERETTWEGVTTSTRKVAGD